MHCGACDVACPAGTTCSSFSCRCDVAGQTLCGSSCFDLANDPLHCGSCTTACVAGRTCTAGACVCPSPVASSAIRLTTSIAASEAPAVAAATDRAAIVWMDGSAGARTLMLALLRPDGTRVTSDVTLVTTSRGLASPAVVWSGTEIAVAWAQQEATSSAYRPMFLRVSVDGVPVGTPLDVATGWPAGSSASQVAIAHHATNGYALAGSTSDTVYFQLLGADGSGMLPLPVPVTLAGGFSSPRGLELVSASDGRWAIARSSSSAGTHVQVVNADGSITTSSFAPTADGFAHDLTHDGSTWVMPLSLWTSGTGYRPVVARGATLGTTLAFRTPTATRVVEASLSAWGREALGISVVYPDSSSTTAGALEVARVTLPAGATGTMTLVTPSRPLGGVTTISKTWPLASAHFDGGRAIFVWSDSRWGQLEIYAMPLTLTSCL